MIGPQLLEFLRCPVTPASDARLALEDNRLVCQLCAMRFQIRDGFPVLIVQEAELPEGCRGLHELPCRHGSGQR